MHAFSAAADVLLRLPAVGGRSHAQLRLPLPESVSPRFSSTGDQFLWLEMKFSLVHEGVP